MRKMNNLQNGKSDVCNYKQKIDLVNSISRNHERERVPELEAMLEDRCALVREAALQALVLDLGQSHLESRCWQILEDDEDEEVRAMAVNCIGSIHHNSRDSDIMSRLYEMMKNDNISTRIKAALYPAFLRVSGLSLLEWLDAVSGQGEFSEGSIDWSLVEKLMK